MIPQRNLSLLANRLFKDHGGRRVHSSGKLLIMIGHVVMYAYCAFLIGWLVPLGLGIYRLGQR
jgi:hypothetical protein